MDNNISQIIPIRGNIRRVNNALVEDVFSRNTGIGYILISSPDIRQFQTGFMENLRLNVNRNTVVTNSFGQNICLCDIRPGMRVDAIFSPVMTRSIPPQTNAFLIVVRRGFQPPSSVTTDRIARVDAANSFVYTGNPRNINSQTRFFVSDSTSITNRRGNPISIWELRPGQMVRITHANFQTASIPPQTTAFQIQVL